MSRFTVVWLKDAEHELTEIWIAHNDRNAVTKATNEIDASLAADPLNQGGELSEGIRFFLVPPLRVIYSVKELDRIVEVSLVRTV